MIFDYDKKDYLVCKNCFYKISKPFPEICPNPNCLKPLEEEEKEEKDKQSAAGSFADNILRKNIEKQLEPREPRMAETTTNSSHVKEIEVSKAERNMLYTDLEDLRELMNRKRKERTKLELKYRETINNYQ